MKKFLIALFLILAISNLSAEDFILYHVEICESTTNQFYFFCGLESSEHTMALALYEKGFSSSWLCYDDSFLNQSVNPETVGWFLFYPKSFSLPENALEDMIFPDFSGSTYDPEENPDGYIWVPFYSDTMLPLINALLNDGFVLFDLEYVDILHKDENGNSIIYSKRYYWNIPDEESRTQALNTFNRFVEFFYE